MDMGMYSNEGKELHSATIQSATGRRGAAGRVVDAWSMANAGDEKLEQGEGEELLETEEQANEYVILIKLLEIMDRLLTSEQAMLLFIRSVSIFVSLLSMRWLFLSLFLF